MANQDNGEKSDRFSMLEIDDVTLGRNNADEGELESFPELEIPGYEPDLSMKAVNNNQKLTWDMIANVFNGSSEGEIEDLPPMSPQVKELVLKVAEWQFKNQENIDLELIGDEIDKKREFNKFINDFFWRGVGGIFELLENVNESRREEVLISVLSEPRIALKTAYVLVGLMDMGDFMELCSINPEVLFSVCDLVRRFEKDKNSTNERLDEDEPVFKHVFDEKLVDLYTEMDPAVMQHLIMTLADKFSKL